MRDQIADLVAHGTPHYLAAQAVGIDQSTFYRCINAHPEFKALLDSQRAQSIAARVKRIKEAGEKGVWQADAWYLERQVPEQFMQRSKLDQDTKFIVEIRTVSQDNRQVIDLEPEVPLLESPGAPLDTSDLSCEGED